MAERLSEGQFTDRREKKKKTTIEISFWFLKSFQRLVDQIT